MSQPPAQSNGEAEGSTEKNVAMGDSILFYSERSEEPVPSNAEGTIKKHRKAIPIHLAHPPGGIAVDYFSQHSAFVPFLTRVSLLNDF